MARLLPTPFINSHFVDKRHPPHARHVRRGDRRSFVDWQLLVLTKNQKPFQ
jgi:hypothetical protein